MPQRGISRQSSLILGLPNVKLGLDATAKPLLMKVYGALKVVLAIFALTIGVFSAYTLTRCVTKHIECVNIYSSCLWKGAWPAHIIPITVFLAV